MSTKPGTRSCKSIARRFACSGIARDITPAGSALVHHIRLLTAAALLSAAASFSPPHAAAQQTQDWFVPGQQRSGAPSRPGPSHPSAGRPQRASPQATMPMSMPSQEAEPAPPPIQVELPPAPEVPPLPKSASPPAAVIGVLGLADISRNSVAAQQVDKALNERMTKLHDDAQKEQVAWRDVQQQLATQRNGLSPEQIRAKERELQERVTNAQRKFRDRNRIIQEAAQYTRAQIERTLRLVVIQVADSHGMNLVVHQEQVVLNAQAFDITKEVVDELNKVLPSVVIPPDGVSVSQLPGAAPADQVKAGAPAATALQTPNSQAPAAAGPPAVAPTSSAAGTPPASAPPAPNTSGPRVAPQGQPKRP